MGGNHTIKTGRAIGIIFLFIVLTVTPIVFFGSSVDVCEVPLPDLPGPYHVGRYRICYDVSPYGRYWATIRYPAIRDGLLAQRDISGNLYPGIVVSNGWAGTDWSIKWIPHHLASHGFVTICFTPPNNKLGDTSQWTYGFLRGIEKLKSENRRRLSPIYNILETEIFGAIGLSKGGEGCIEATGAVNSEIDSAIALAPSSGGISILAAQNISVPIQLQVGNNDSLIPPYRVLPYYHDYVSNFTVKEYLAINGGNHIGFIDEFYARVAEWIGIEKFSGIEYEEQRRISSKYFVSWFQYFLNEISEYYTYIFGEEAKNDLEIGILTDLKYNIPSQ